MGNVIYILSFVVCTCKLLLLLVLNAFPDSDVFHISHCIVTKDNMHLCDSSSCIYTQWLLIQRPLLLWEFCFTNLPHQNLNCCGAKMCAQHVANCLVHMFHCDICLHVVFGCWLLLDIVFTLKNHASEFRHNSVPCLELLVVTMDVSITRFVPWHPLQHMCAWWTLWPFWTSMLRDLSLSQPTTENLFALSQDCVGDNHVHTQCFPWNHCFLW